MATDDLGVDQRAAVEWIASEGGTAYGPKGDRVLNSLVRRGLVTKKVVAVPPRVSGWGKSPTWRPRPGTWAAWTLVEWGSR